MKRKKAVTRRDMLKAAGAGATALTAPMINRGRYDANHDEHFIRIESPPDLERVKKSGKVGLLLGLQYSDHIGRPADHEISGSLGQRVSQLTYNSPNLIRNGSTEMNGVGMAVDDAHSGDRTTLAAFEISRRSNRTGETNEIKTNKI